MSANASSPRLRSTDFIEQLVALGSPEAALTHVDALAEHFETGVAGRDRWRWPPITL